MFGNYLKIAFRNILKHKGYSAVIIAGLALGLACCIYILIYVQFHLGVDGYHDDIDRVYRVLVSQKTASHHEIARSCYPLMAQALKEKFPEVEYSVNINAGWEEYVSCGDRMFREQGLYHSNPDILKVFRIPFVRGNPGTALTRPKTAVLSRDMAAKCFDARDPIGKTLTVGDTEYEITGIIENPPDNTQFKYNIIMSWETVKNHELFRDWRPGILATSTFVKLKPGTDAKAFEQKIHRLPHEYMAEALEKKGTTSRLLLQPVKDGYLHSITPGGIKGTRVLNYIYIFSAVGILILLIACMNFMNLATARSANRAGEVGVRKVVGAERSQLVWQFLSESVVVTLMAFAVAVLLVELLFPFFNQLAGFRLSYKYLLQPGVLLGLFILFVFVSAAAGMYPAVFLSAFKPAAVLKGVLRRGSRGAGMRRVLVMLQFVISIVMLVATISIYNQISFMKSQPLGFEKEQKMVVVLKNWGMVENKYEAIKNEFLGHPGIIDATASSGVPGYPVNRTWIFPYGQEAEKGMAFRSLRSDHDFLKVFGIKLAAGRHFQKDISTDVQKAMIINEAGVKALGWKNPREAIGKFMGMGSRDRIPIIGVVKDFHWFGLQRDIEPMLIRVVPSLFRSFAFTVSTKNVHSTVSFVERKYKELFPGDMFEYFFVDKNFSRQYHSEERLGTIAMIFTVFGLLVACLGLFGLASFVAEQRTKEIGIRKALGAPVSGIVMLLSGEFAKWVAAANIIAWPIAYFAVGNWLDNFAYHAGLGLGTFILAGFLAMTIALLTVGFHTVKAARANPVKALKYE